MKAQIASVREVRTRLADLPAPHSFCGTELEGLPDPVRRYLGQQSRPARHWPPAPTGSQAGGGESPV